MTARKRSSLVAHLLRGNAVAEPSRAPLPAASLPAASLPPVPLNPRIGHNAGPPLDDHDPETAWQLFCWSKAHKEAWKTPPREIALRRLARAEELGMSYRDYTAVVLDTGRFL